MTLDDLPLGLQHMQSITVGEALTVPAVSAAFTGFTDMPPVFATAFMVGFVEWTCIEALRPYLTFNQRTVGTHIDMSHTAATPVGMQVTAQVELVAIDGKRLRFRVTCRDESEVIGTGFHERAAIEKDRFLVKVGRKKVSL
jgi:fluoroacetyl-CoA thioesterase